MEISGLYRRGNVWWFQAPQVGNIRPKPISLKTRYENEAIAKVLDIRNTPEYYAPESWTQTVEEYLEHQQEKKKLSRLFIVPRRCNLLGFSRMMGVQRPENVSQSTVQQYYDKLIKKGLKARTAQTYVLGVSAFYGWLMKQKKAGMNPALGIDMRHVPHFLQHQTCSKEQVEAIINGCTDDNMMFCLLCGFDAGLRKNEIIQAVPEWFMNPGIIYVKNSEHYEVKDGESRYIPLTKRFQAFLRGYGLKKPFMAYPEINHDSLYRVNLLYRFKLHVKSVGLPWVTIQTMRHTFASLRVQAGVSVYKVARWLGDGVGVVERHYGHLAPTADDAIEI